MAKRFWEKKMKKFYSEVDRWKVKPKRQPKIEYRKTPSAQLGKGERQSNE